MKLSCGHDIPDAEILAAAKRIPPKDVGRPRGPRCPICDRVPSRCLSTCKGRLLVAQPIVAILDDAEDLQ